MRLSKQEIAQKYRINYDDLIHDNNISRIFKGQIVLTKQSIIVKQTSFRKLSDSKSTDKQAILLRELNHPNIIKMYDSFSDNGICQMFLQQAICSLRSFTTKEKTLSKQTILKISRQISDAMSFVHSKNILHLDLKPQNIMLAKDYSIRIIDFGESLKNTRTKLAKNTNITCNYCPSFALKLTNSEQIVQFDQSFDVWSFGVILYQLITGNYLFQGSNKIKVLNSMNKFQKNYQQILSTEQIKQKVFRQILIKSLKINKEQRISFSEITKIIDDSHKSQGRIKILVLPLKQTTVLPTLQISNHSQQNQFKTQNTYYKLKKPYQQSKKKAILIIKYIEYFRFKLSQANLLLDKIMQTSEQNGLEMILNKLQIGILKLCLFAIVYQINNKIIQIAISQQIHLPTGQSIKVQSLHKMIIQQTLNKYFKQVNSEYMHWNQNNTNDSFQLQLIQQLSTSLNSDALFLYPSFVKNFKEKIFNNPYKHIALIIKKYVLQIQNLTFKQNISQITRIQQQPKVKRDIYFCSMISALDRILPESQFQSNQIKRYYNDLKTLSNNQLIKETLKNTLFSLDTVTH